MRIRNSLFTVLLVLNTPILLHAQAKYYQADTSIKVYAYGRQQTLAWCGGFNTPQFAMADLNHDGLPDLVIYEPWNSLRTFINQGKEGAPDYRYSPEYALNFPSVLDYLVLADYNCDGVSDLFHRGSYGYSAYKGYYNEYNQLSFTYYKDLFYDNDLTSPFPLNAYTNSGDIPSIVDVDGDGDLDFVSYYVSSTNFTTLYWYKNMRVEKNLPCDSIVIELADRCWGRVQQGNPRTHQLAYSCDESHLVMGKTSKTTCAGNACCLFDWDMDGDYDYIDGSINFNEMTFLQNGRIPNNPTGPDSMVYQDTLWQSSPDGTQIELPSWPAAFNIDIDQDGKKDLLIAPNAAQLSTNYNNIWFYKNYSTPGVPDWRFQSDSFLTDMAIDLGTGSYPVLFDFNKDGKPDLFVGSDGYFQHSDGTLRSKISYYLNTSTPGNPSFTLQTNDFLGIGAMAFRGIAPAFGDIDNDGKADMVIGHTDGTLSYYKNMAASDSVAPDWELMELVLTDMNGDTINVLGHAAPFIYDIDKDGKKDLIIGNILGTIQYYQNVATVPGAISLKLVNMDLGQAKADPDNSYGNYSVPFIGKIDSTGTEYLLLGSNSGNIYQYTGFQGGDTTATYTLVNGSYSYIDSTFNVYNHPVSTYAYYGGLRSAVTVGDVGGDGTLNMLVGDNKGGLYSYTRQVYKAPPVVNHTGVPSVNENGSILVYPNPAKDVLTVSWSGVLQPEVQISFINMEGQTLFNTSAPTSANHAALSIEMLPSGIYACIVQSGINRYYNKFTVVR